MKKLISLVAVAGLMLSACGSGDDDNGNDAADTTTTTTAAADDRDGNSDVEAGFASKLLTVADLPAGFTQSGEITEENGSIGDSDNPFCDGLEASAKKYPPNHEAQADFEQGDEESVDGLLLIAAVSRYDSASIATQATDDLKAAFAGCATFSNTDEDGATLAGTFTNYNYSTGAEQAFGTRMDAAQSAEGESVNFDGDFIVQRKGQYVIVIGVLAIGAATFSAENLKSVSTKALAKV